MGMFDSRRWPPCYFAKLKNFFLITERLRVRGICFRSLQMTNDQTHSSKMKLITRLFDQQKWERWPPWFDWKARTGRKNSSFFSLEVTYFLPAPFRSVVEAAGAQWRPLARPHDMDEEGKHEVGALPLAGVPWYIGLIWKQGPTFIQIKC